MTENWPGFLGLRHNATSNERPLRKQWPADGPPLVWEMEAGNGYAAPAIAGDRLVYFHRIGDHDVVDCVHPENGKSYWRYSYPTDYQDRYGFSNGPRSSPVIDEQRVFTYGAQGQLHCLDLMSGRVIWQQHPTRQYNITNTYFGVGSTPLVEKEALIVAVGAPGPAVVAYDKATGKTLWTTHGEWAASYASPVSGVIHGQRRVFLFAGGDSRPPTGGLLSIDPTDGQVSFRFPWRPNRYESVNAASPVIVEDQVFISAAYDKGGVLLKIKPDGACTVAWTTMQLRAHWCTPIHHDGYLYGVDGDGQNDAALVCVDLRDGKAVWREQLEWTEEVTRNGIREPMSFGLMRGSLLFADGHFLALGEMGHLLWLDLSPQGCKVLQRAWLFPARESFTAPVLSRGLLYVTQNKKGFVGQSGERLLCYDLRPVANGRREDGASQ